MNKLQTTSLELPGVLTIQTPLYRDERGFFMESYNDQLFAEILKSKTFVQDNVSLSAKGVFRGMHTQQEPYAQSKLVRVLSGHIIDVVLDIDPTSPHYGKACIAELSQANATAIYIPAGYAHGFLSMTDHTLVQYKVDAYYHPEAEQTYHYHTYGIDTLLSNYIPASDWIISDKDNRQE